MKRTITMTLLFTLAVFPLAAGQTNSGKQKFPLNPCIIDTLRARGNFVVLLRGLEAAGLDKTIRQSKAVTIFAPNDAAFAKLPQETLESLMKEPGGMKQLLANHILVGRVSLKEMVAGRFSSVTNLGGAAILKIHVSCDAEGCLLGTEKEAQVVNDDIVASNGLIIETDHVMFRPIFNPPSRW
jgi:uncharacterized surface protein with fasciclin (FAS1) repeats